MRVFLYLAILPVAVFTLTASVEGTLIQADGRMGLLQDPVLLIAAVLLPLSVVLMARLLGIADKTFTNDLQSSLIKAKYTEGEYRNDLARYWGIVAGIGDYRKYKHLIMFAGLFWVYSSLAHYHYWGYDQSLNIWSFGSDHLLSFSARTTWELVSLIFVYPVLIYQLGALIYVMNSFFRQRHDCIRVRVVAPDGAGGLGHMGTLALNLEFIFVPFIVLAVVYALVNEGPLPPVFLIEFALLVLLLVSAFFVPLSSAHKAMENAKERVLHRLATNFNAEYDKAFQTLQGSLANEAIVTKIEWMEKLKYVYEEAEKMPVWPFDLRTLRRFSATVLFPIVVVIIGETLAANL